MIVFSAPFVEGTAEGETFQRCSVELSWFILQAMHSVCRNVGTCGLVMSCYYACHSVSRAFASSLWLPSSSLVNVEVRWSGKSAAAGCGERGKVTDDVLGWKVDVFFLTDQFKPAN